MPPSSAITGISIFIDSMSMSVSPCATFCPTRHSIFQTDPLTSDFAVVRSHVYVVLCDVVRNIS